MSNNSESPFRLKKSGLHRVGSDGTLTRIAPYIKVLGEGLIEGADQFVVVLKYQANDDVQRTIVNPRADLINEKALTTTLMNGGYRMPTEDISRDDVFSYLRTPARVSYRIVLRTGHVEGAYVRGDGRVVGKVADGTKILYRPANAPRFAYPARGGSIEGWRTEVAAPALCSNRMVFAISVSLAALLIEPLSGESGVFHFFSQKSSIGKSVLEMVALSVHGRARREDLPHWDVTGTGLDELAAEHCDRVLVLDDTGRLSPNPVKAAEKARKTAFKIASGIGRIRSSWFGRQGNQCRWRIYVISSGEQGISELAIQAGKKRLKGDEVRMIDIPAEGSEAFGVFESVPEGKTSAELVGQVEEGCRTHYGHPQRLFLKLMRRDLQATILTANSYRNRFIKMAQVPDIGWERRFAQRFAIAYAAGRLGIEHGILPWKKKQLLAAILDVYRAARAAIPDLEQKVDGAIATIADRLRSKKRLRDLRPGADRTRHPSVADADGFIKADPSDANVVMYAIKPKALKRWLGADEDLVRWVGRRLLEREMLYATARGLATKQLDIKGAEQKARYFCIKAQLIA